MIKRQLYLLIIFVFITKLVLIFVVNTDLKVMNPDEEKNYQIALNHQQGKGYTIFDPEKKAFYPTAFHASFPVFIYEFLIKNDLKKEYWVFFIYMMSLLLFIVSVPFFYKLSGLFISNDKHAFFATVTYCFYPSLLFYIGSLFAYENIVLPLLVIMLFKLLSALKKNKFQYADYFTIPFCIALSCLLRPQTIAVYALVFFIYLVCILKNKMYRLTLLLGSTILFTALLHLPVLLKNKMMFGEYILSNQSGFEFLQGHNPGAKGSWMGNWRDSTSELYIYTHTKIPDIATLNEAQESKARKEAGIAWIRENPLAELKLDLRKAAIYFLPKNFEVLRTSDMINPVNLLVHLLFLCAACMLLYKRAGNADQLLLFAPIAASLALSVVFFVGYRWRYYAEPFMIIFAWMFIAAMLQKRKT